MYYAELFRGRCNSFDEKIRYSGIKRALISCTLPNIELTRLGGVYRFTLEQTY